MNVMFCKLKNSLFDEINNVKQKRVVFHLTISEYIENNNLKLMHNLNLSIIGWTFEQEPCEISSVKLRLCKNSSNILPENPVFVVVVGKVGISANELFCVDENEEKVFHLNGSLTNYEFIPMTKSKQLLIIDKNIFSGIEKLVTKNERTDCNEICRK